MKEVVPANEKVPADAPRRLVQAWQYEGRIIIAGGGPVGLIVGLVLGRAGVKVQAVRSGRHRASHPRAATIHPATLDILDDLGVYERIEPLGHRLSDRQLLRSAGAARLLRSRHARGRDPPSLGAAMRAGQAVARAVCDGRRTCPKLEIRTETKVVDCSQSADGVEVSRRGRRQAGTAPGQLSDRGRRRAQHGAQADRRRVRGLHLRRALHDHRHALRLLAGRLRLSQLHLRSGGMVQSVQDFLERTARRLSPGGSGPAGRGAVEGDANVGNVPAQVAALLPARSSPTRSSSTTPTWCSQRVAATFRAGTRAARRRRRPSQQPDRRHGDEQRHPRCRQPRGQHAARARREESDGALDRYVRQRRHVAVEHVQTATIANKKNMEQRDPETRRKYREEMQRAPARIRCSPRNSSCGRR